MARTRGAKKDLLASADPSLPPTRVVPRPQDADGRIDWSQWFDPDRPVEADIGCGMGRFLLARSRMNPGVQYLGLELESARIVHIDVAARREGLENLRLLQGDALLSLPLLPDGFLRAATVFFPDPWPKRRHWRRRLVQAPFLDAVHRVLAPGGLLHLATDQSSYFDSMERLLDPDPRFERVPAPERTPDEWTDFERLFRAKGLPVYEGAWRRRPAE